MHGTMLLFIVTEYSFIKITITSSNLNMRTIEKARDIVVFSSCSLAEQVLMTLSHLCWHIHRARMPLIQSSSFVFVTEATTHHLNEGVLQHLLYYT